MKFILNNFLLYLLVFDIGKSLTDGLNFYELVLLVLGVILFIVILIILIIFAIQKRSFKSLIWFFIISIVMIGYPSIQKISFDGTIITIEKATEKLAKNPNDTEAEEELNNALNKVQIENISNPQTLATISKGYAVIGDTVSALTFVEKAVQSDSQLDEANRLYKKFNKPEIRIDRITDEIKNNPNDKVLINNLEKEVAKLEDSPNLNASKYEMLANSYAIIGDTNKVLRFTDSLARIDPSSPQVIELRRKFIKR